MEIKNKIDLLLSHVAGLEECFDSCPSDEAELRRRDGTMLYAMIHILMDDSKFLLVSSGALRDNCRRSWGSSHLLITLKTHKTYSDFSKIFRSQSSAIRFVYDPALSSKLTRVADGATKVDQRSRT